MSLFYLIIFAVIIYYYSLSYNKLADEIREIKDKCIKCNNDINKKNNITEEITSIKLTNNPLIGFISYILDVLNNNIRKMER